jgi:hypothetical protein
MDPHTDSLMSAEDFVSVWETSSSLTEVAVRLRAIGISLEPTQVESWANCLRTFGVSLKEIPRGALPPFKDDEILLTVKEETHLKVQAVALMKALRSFLRGRPS